MSNLRHFDDFGQNKAQFHCANPVFLHQLSNLLFMKQLLKRLCLLAILITILSACTEQPAPTLAFREREIVDSLYRHQVDSLKPIYDSLCTARFDSAVQFKTDSMLKVRTAEIQKALERLRQKTNQ